MNAFDQFLEGPLLTIVLAIFVIAVIYRLACFITASFRGDRSDFAKEGNPYISLARFFVPFHKGVVKKPIYGLLRYIFHLCLIIVPIWFSGHIGLWETSRLRWEWAALPDGLADGMTVIVIVLGIYFLFRRIASSYIRRDSSVSDYLLIVIAVIPFATGFGLTHGAPEHPVRTIHVLSGELFLIVAVFLFVRAWLSAKRCTGCAACEVECPTGTMMSVDEDAQRTFTYNHYQCIDCGTCVMVCPEDAAELRHAISFKKLFNIISKERIRSVELSRCESCGELIAPNPQVDKVGSVVPKGVVHLCNKCKAKFNAENREGTELPIYFPSADIKKEATHESGINQGI